MSFIGSFARGDWGKGLAGMFGGSVGEGIYGMATGQMSGGEFAKQIGIEAGTTLATAGLGAGLGKAAGALAKVATTSAQAGTKAASIGAKMATGASRVLGKTANLINPSSGKVTGGAAPVPVPSSGSLASKIGAKLPGQAKLGIPNAAKVGIPGTLPGNTIKYSIPQGMQQASSNALGRMGSALRGAANTAKNKAGKVTGQGVIQGVLSIASAAGAAKQAAAANKVSEQSLLFQKQSYEDQKAEMESNKAKLKSDAWTDYNSASLFGEYLYNSDSNSTLLTNYHTNGTGNAGNFSLIGSGISVSKQTDLT